MIPICSFGNFASTAGGHAEILGQDFRRGMGKPVRHKKRIELRGLTIVEDDQELAPVWPETWSERGKPAGKYQMSPSLMSRT
jgi:hypothetical protein